MFAREWIDRKFTPLFEWCEQGRAVGVICHSHSSLVLTAMRHMETGGYLPYKEMCVEAAKYNIPVTNRIIAEELGHSGGGGGVCTLEAVKEMVASWVDKEGVVLALPDGHRYKIKTSWYTSLANASMLRGKNGLNFLIEAAKQRPTLVGVPPLAIWSLAVVPHSEGADDVLAQCSSALAKGGENSKKEMLELQKFYLAVQAGIQQLRTDLLAWGKAVREATHGAPQARKGAIAMATRVNWTGQVVSAAVEGFAQGLSEQLSQFVRALCVKGRFEALQALLGAQWHPSTATFTVAAVARQTANKAGEEEEGEKGEQEADTSDFSTVMSPHTFPLSSGQPAKHGGGAAAAAAAPETKQAAAAAAAAAQPQHFEFHTCTKRLRQHVLQEYLPRKVANYLGISVNRLTGDTALVVPSNYSGAEGKIKGLWEMFEREGVLDLRVDLQPPSKHGFDEHYGDSTTANWLVQYGPSKVSKRSSKTKQGCEGCGSFAGVLMSTDTPFSFEDLCQAMELSFQCRQHVVLRRQRTVGNKVEEAKTSLPQTKEEPQEAWALPLKVERIFCDLDGVLADFDKGLANLNLQPSANLDDMWHRIEGTRFFAELDWTSDGKGLWTYLVGMGAAVEILSGLPTGKVGKSAKKHKFEWCRKQLGADIRVNVCLSHEKAQYSGHGRVLIDDRQELATAWEAAGGIFIHHHSTVGSIAQLRLHLEPQWAHELRREAERLCQHSNLDGTMQDSNVVWVSGKDGAGQLVAAVEDTESYDLVAFDVEWRPDELLWDLQPHTVKGKGQKAPSHRSAAAILQLALASSEFSSQGTKGEGNLKDSSHKIRIFVVDMVAVTDEITNLLHTLLTDHRVLKLGFGVAGDLARLEAVFRGQSSRPVMPVLDLQRAISALVPMKPGIPVSNRPVSLTAAVSRVLGFDIVKGKTLQACDWEKRPLSSAHLQYAADDAAVLVHLYQKLASSAELTAALPAFVARLSTTIRRSKKNRCQYVFSSLKWQSNSKAEDEKELRTLAVQVASSAQQRGSATPLLSSGALRALRPLFTGVFLSKEDRQQLLQALPSCHPTNSTHADHVTLIYKPIAEDLATFPAGNKIEIKVVGHVADTRIHAARVELNFVDEDSSDSKAKQNVRRLYRPGKHLHITLGAAPGVPASYSNDLLANTENKYHELAEPLVLEGTTGVAFLGFAESSSDKEPADLLATTPKKIATKVRDFMEMATAGENLRFRATELSSSERFALHSFAESVGLLSRSEGQGVHRRLILTAPRNFREQRKHSNHSKWGDHKNGVRYTVKEPLLFAALLTKIDFCSSTTAPAAGFGRVTPKGVTWDQPPSAVVQNLLNPTLPGPPAVTVVILRGLPGSGKSSFATLVTAVHETQGIPVVKCSADEFFEGGAGVLRKRDTEGMVPADIYRKCFSTSLLPAAHEYCQQRFKEALEEAVGKRTSAVVMVDNTNIRVRDFSCYLEQASQISRSTGSSTAADLKNEEKDSFSIAVVVVELTCASRQDLTAFQERNQHGVPAADIAKMWSRWETIAPSEILEKVGLPVHIVRLSQVGGLNHKPSTAADTTLNRSGGYGYQGNLRRWMQENHCFHFSKSRPATHLAMACAGLPSSFVFVHPKLEQEFLTRYASEPSDGKFLMEFLSVPVFRMFFDIDCVAPRPLLACELEALARAVQVVLRTCLSEVQDPRNEETPPDYKVLVTGIATGSSVSTPNDEGKIKTGLHLKCPGTYVTVKQARALRDCLVWYLDSGRWLPPSEYSGCDELEIDWEAAVDKEVYTVSRGLRMLGSRKANNQGADVGRVYSLLHVQPDSSLGACRDLADKLKNEYANDYVRLLQDASIRVSMGTQPTSDADAALVRRRARASLLPCVSITGGST